MTTFFVCFQIQQGKLEQIFWLMILVLSKHLKIIVIKIKGPIL